MIHLKRILIIEDEEDHAEIIKRHLLELCSPNCTIEWQDTLAKGIEALTAKSFDVVLLDLGLPGSSRENTLRTALQAAESIPIVILSAMKDEEFALEAVHRGVQDYICKGQISQDILFRAIRYAIERKKTEEQLKLANKSKDEFLSILSHELRSPVALIQGYSEVLMNESTPSEVKDKAIEVIYRQARHQLALVDDLLEMSRIINGKIVLKKDAQDLVEVVENALEAQHLEITEKKIRVVKSYDSIETIVNGDQNRLHQIMVNILSNAVKFSSYGGKIEVSVKRKGSRIEVQVKDYGKGIKEEFLPMVFEHFKQQDAGIVRKYGGMGLGMAITKKLVLLHGGQISVHSDGIDKGACFTLRFPLLAVKNIALGDHYSGDSDKFESGLASNNSWSFIAGNVLKGLRILIIDDNPDVLTLVETVLSMHGAQVTKAESGNEALNSIGTINPDVLICDIGMPEQDGYSFVKQLRSIEYKKGNKAIPAAALTAYARKEDRQKALAAGFNMHLTKPINEQDLIKSITDLIKSS